LEDYARQNATSWYIFAEARGWRVTDVPLCLVTGFHKAERWALATSEVGEFVLLAKIGGWHDGKAWWEWRWEGDSVHGSVDKNYEGYQNQCIFVRGFQVLVTQKFELRRLSWPMEIGGISLERLAPRPRPRPRPDDMAKTGKALSRLFARLSSIVHQSFCL
jgi:hypothetical protein